MNHNERRGPWEVPGLTQRLQALHADPAVFSNSEIADKLNCEFGLRPKLTRNAVIGKSRRLALALRKRVKAEHKTRVYRKFRPGKPAVRVEAPIPPRPAPRRVGKALTIYQLDRGVCHFPLGEMHDVPPYLYCGQPEYGGRSYCAEHHARAYWMPSRGVRE